MTRAARCWIRDHRRYLLIRMNWVDAHPLPRRHTVSASTHLRRDVHRRAGGLPDIIELLRDLGQHLPGGSNVGRARLGSAWLTACSTVPGGLLV